MTVVTFVFLIINKQNKLILDAADPVIFFSYLFFSDESVKFFCFQVLEHHIKTRYDVTFIQ